MFDEPGLHQLAMVGADIVTYDVNESDRRNSRVVDQLKQLNELDLTLARATNANDLAGPGIERSE